MSFITLLFIAVFPLHAQEPSDSAGSVSDDGLHRIHFVLNGQITGWETTQLSNPVNWQPGCRFLPVLLGDFSWGENSKLDAEASVHLYGLLNFTGWDYINKEGKLKPYRVWLRYSGKNWELRGGLQKINFGTARMFRPLMWFDAMDVRDPLQLTDGVYGILGKYFFENNASVWLWSLLGNKRPKGWELVGSTRRRPEIGGRFEFPAFAGEMGVSTHHRKTDVHHLLPDVPENTLLDENRVGLDGRWDVGVGLWFETSFTRLQKNNYKMALHQDAINVGMDYTFPLGNGLGLTVEYFRYHTGDGFMRKGMNLNVIGEMLSYPVSVLDNLTAMFFYVGNDLNMWLNYISWARTYDKWSFYLMGFWNPEVNLPLGGQAGGKNLFMGKGIQLMASYNF